MSKIYSTTDPVEMRAFLENERGRLLKDEQRDEREEKVQLGDGLFYEEGSDPRRHVILSGRGLPYVALDDAEAIAFARQLEPVRTAVDALRAIAGGNVESFDYTVAHGLPFMASSDATHRVIARAALVAMEEEEWWIHVA